MKGIKQVNNYRFIKEVGKGATAIVYEAIDEKKNILVAVKQIPSRLLEVKRVIENFKRELNILGKLNHENIIKIKGIEKTSRNFYLILEYCNGGNLLDFMLFYKKKKKKEMSEFLVQKILRQITSALHYMHENKMIHRDIKLENILINFPQFSNEVIPGSNPIEVDLNNIDLNCDFTVKIADLGYARELESIGVASTICGTPITMAPDILNLEKQNIKDRKYNTKADLWSLGATTYELLIGKPPFFSNQISDLIKKINKGNYSVPKNLKLSVECISFINGLLQFNPEKRMTWEQIKNHPFLKNNVENFHFIDLKENDNLGNDDEINLNTKNCDNFLWLQFKNTSFNMELDQVNEENINKPEMQKIIKDNAIKNKELLKEVEEEKKKILEEKKKIKAEKEEAELIKEEAEKLKREAEELQKKNAQENEKIKQKEQKQKEIEKNLEKKEREIIQKEKIKKKEQTVQLEEEKKIIEQERQKTEKMKQEAEELLQKANKLKLDMEREKKQTEEKEKKQLEENEKNQKEQKEKEKQRKDEEEKIKRELEQLRQEALLLKKELDERKVLEKKLIEKEKEKENLIKKMEQITNEKDMQILQIEKEKKDKELELLQSQKHHEEEQLKLKEELLRQQIEKKEKEINDANNCDFLIIEDEWEDLQTSIDMECEVSETSNEYEIINNYIEEN